MCTRRDPRLYRKYASQRWAWKVFKVDTNNRPLGEWNNPVRLRMDEVSIALPYGKVYMQGGEIAGGVFHCYAHERDAGGRSDGKYYVKCRVEIIEYWGAGIGVYIPVPVILAKRIRIHSRDWQQALQSWSWLTMRCTISSMSKRNCFI